MAAAPVMLPDLRASSSEHGFNWGADLNDAALRAQLSRSAIKGFLNIADRWNLTEVQSRALLGGIASSTLHAWKTNPAGTRLSQDTLTRISLVLGMYTALRTYFGDEWADRWIVLGNRGYLFGGRPPVDYMIQHGLPGMLEVRRLLDSWHGGQ